MASSCPKDDPTLLVGQGTSLPILWYSDDGYVPYEEGNACRGPVDDVPDACASYEAFADAAGLRLVAHRCAPDVGPEVTILVHFPYDPFGANLACVYESAGRTAVGAFQYYEEGGWCCEDGKHAAYQLYGQVPTDMDCILELPEVR